MKSLRGLFVLNDDALQLVYGSEEQRDIERHVDWVGLPQTVASISRRPELLRDVDVLFTGWGAPVLTRAFLNSAPSLKVVFYAAGSLSGVLTDAVWQRGIAVTTAIEANSAPVAEYALSVILFSLKHGWRLARQVRDTRSFQPRDGVPGAYRSTIGLISLGTVARRLLELLRPLDMKIVAYDPFVTSTEARQLGVTLVSLEDLFCTADAVSLHAPSLPEVEGLINREHFAAMKCGATFINTARAEIVRQDEMIEVALSRPDLQFILDVAAPEPPASDSPLYTLPNVVLTPHIAGSAGPECRRMGRYMVEELQRYVAGEPLRWAVSSGAIWNTSHRPLSARGPKPVLVQESNCADSVAV